jgi:hypothetical protein
LARVTSASASSSSQWPTPDSGLFGDGHDPAIFFARREEVKAKGINGNGMGTPLTVAASSWLTPSANEDAAGTVDGKMQRMLTHQAKESSDLWSTPRASDGEKGGPNQSFGAGGTPLPAQTVQWATPCARDHMPAHSPEYIAAKKAEGHGMKILTDQADSFLQAHPTYQDGQVSSHPRRSLNPLFVEWLMGWPPGWTLLAWTDFACSVTELSAWKRRMRFALLHLGLPAEGPPVQRDLFA